MHPTEAEILEALQSAAQDILALRTRFNRLAAQAKIGPHPHQERLNKAASLVDDCAGSLEELADELDS